MKINTWVSDDSKIKIRKVFEPKYGRELGEDEVVEIANNLTCFVEDYLKFEWRMQYGKTAVI